MKWNNPISKEGFSLVEVIIAITILGVIGLVSSTILSRTYRVNIQSDTTSKLKQNAEQAMSMITEVLRNSEGVACYSSAAPIKSLVVRTLSGKYVKFRFVDPVTSQNGYIIKQENLNSDDFANFCSLVIVSPAEVAITNKDTSSGVSISDGEFTKIAGSGGKDQVTIKFKVNPSLTSGGALSSEIFSVQTTIQIR